MAFEITVKQASEILNVSVPRIYQLINEGLLPAEKIAGRYFIEEDAVRARADLSPKPGRPSKRSMASLKSYTLMNRDHEVLDFAYDDNAKEFHQVLNTHDLSRAPFGIASSRGKNASLAALTYWWAHRAIPVSREGMDAKLASLGFVNTSQVPFKSLGLSLSDQYWIRPYGMSLNWEDITFFRNKFGMLSQNDWLSQVGLDSPDNTSEGALSKRWISRRGSTYLLKGGFALNQEPFNEVVATALHKRLLRNDEFVAYNIKQLNNGEFASICKNFLSDEEEYIPAYYIMKSKSKESYQSDFQHYIECCARLGVEDAELALSKMVVTDDILGNTDRHLRNFGLIRNVETMEYRIAPLFDTGSSLWAGKSLQALESRDYSFASKPFFDDPNRQLRLVNDYDWFDIDKLSDFPDEAMDILGMNESLMPRLPYIKEAIELRLNRIKTIL